MGAQLPSTVSSGKPIRHDTARYDTIPQATMGSGRQTMRLLPPDHPDPSVPASQTEEGARCEVRAWSGGWKMGKEALNPAPLPALPFLSGRVSHWPAHAHWCPSLCCSSVAIADNRPTAVQRARCDTCATGDKWLAVGHPTCYVPCAGRKNSPAALLNFPMASCCLHLANNTR